MNHSLFSSAWWKAALVRGLRTAIVIALPYLGATHFAEVPWFAAASAAVLGFVLSLVTSLAGLVETDGSQTTWWYAILSRVTKTAAQAIASGIGTAVLITDVEWSVVLQAAALAALGSLLLGVLSRLPEASLPSPVVPVAPVAATINNYSVDHAVPAIADPATSPAAPRPPTDV